MKRYILSGIGFIVVYFIVSYMTNTLDFSFVGMMRMLFSTVGFLFVVALFRTKDCKT